MSLSSERIVRAAQNLLTDYGLHDVTMRRLASELGVRPGALYYHVPHKQELLRRVAHQLLAPLQNIDAGPFELMQQFRDIVLPLRDGGDLLLIAYGLDQRIPPVPALEASLRIQGLSDETVQQRSAVIMRFALGAVAAEQNIVLLAGAEVAAEQGIAAEHAATTVQEAPSQAGSAEAAPAQAFSIQTATSSDLYAQGLRSLLAGRA